MYIEYKNICLRNAEQRDCEQLAKWWNDGAVMEHAGFPHGLHTSAKEIMKKIENDSDHTRRRLIIEYDHLSIGEMCYNTLDNRIVEIGIKICNPYFQNKGLGRIILSMLIKELFHDNYIKIVLDTNLNNKRAQHVYEALGFIKVDTKMNCWKDQLGNLQSSVYYELDQEHFIEYK